MKTHDLKTDPHPFSLMWNGTKQYEIRLDDRGYEVGDRIISRETVGPARMLGLRMEFTGRYITAVITHSLGGYGVQPGWVILSVSDIQRWSE